jgi:hypothetical protein
MATLQPGWKSTRLQEEWQRKEARNNSGNGQEKTRIHRYYYRLEQVYELQCKYLILPFFVILAKMN